MSTVLARCAARLRRLRPDWSNPSRYFMERDELARAIELEAAARRQDASPPNFYRQPEPLPDERMRRLAALARAQQARIDRLELLLVQAAQARPSHRRRAPDDRQLVLGSTDRVGC
jgi:hypothetical protein